MACTAQPQRMHSSESTSEASHLFLSQHRCEGYGCSMFAYGQSSFATHFSNATWTDHAQRNHQHMLASLEDLQNCNQQDILLVSSPMAPEA